MISFQRKLRNAELVLVGYLATAGLASAQTSYGSLVGTVTDRTGAVIPGATIVITDPGTEEKHTAITDGSGNYRFVNLLPSSYKVEVTKDAYKRFVLEKVDVAVGVTVRADSKLDVGAASEVVEVTAEAPLLQTDSGQLGLTVEGKTIEEMPLNGRNTMNLIALAPGVVPQGSTSGGTGMNQPGGNTNSSGWNNYQIGGGIAGQSAELLDGVSLNVLGGNGNSTALVPTQDAVQEFNVATNTVSAEFGRFSGGVVNMITKRGTNAVHGSVYEYIRNAAFNANEWFLKQSQIASGLPNKPAKWNQNQYGVVLNGPIVKDKAFFLFTWESFESRNASSSAANVPTNAMQSGTVSEQYTSSGTLIPVADPLGKCAIQHTQGTVANPGTWTAPSSCWDSAAKVIKNYWDAPNTNGAGYNYLIAVPLGDNQNQYNARIDYNLSARQRIFGRYTYWHLADLSFNEFPDNKFNLGNDAVTNVTNEIVLGDTVTVNASTLLDFRLSYLRQQYSQYPPVTNVDESQFGGTWSSLNSGLSVHMYPTFSNSAFGGTYGSLYSSFEGGPNNLNFFNNYALSGNMTKILGNHSIKFGGEFRRLNDETGGTATSGQFSFTGSGPSGTGYTGDNWLDFLLGYANQGSITTTSKVTGYNYYQGYYIQDSWTATSKLTLNGGLRWELPGAIAEANGKATVFLPTAVDPYTSVTGTLALVNSALYPHNAISKSRLYLFAPRAGFAFRLDQNTAIRGGYGLTYLPLDITGNMMPNNSPINSNNSNQFTNKANFAAGNPTLSSPFTSLNQPVGRNNPAFMKQYLGGSFYGPNPADPFPYMQQWNLTASHQFKGDLLVEAGYAGSVGIHLPSVGGGGSPTGPVTDSNELNSTYWSLGPALDSQSKTITTPNASYSSTVSLGQSLRPYPFYQGVGDAAPTWGATNYNSGMIRVMKRFRSGGVVMAGYTHAKMIGNTDTANSFLEVKSSQATHSGGTGLVQDFNNHAGERSLLSYDTPDRFVASYVLPLPFGQGQRFAANVGSGVNRLISGFAINGITSFQSGFPLTFTSSAHTSLANNYGIGQLRPDVVAGCTKNVSGTTRSHIYNNTPVFNAACYVAAGATRYGANSPMLQYTVGNEPRVDSGLRSAGTNNFDLSLVKSTSITERVSVELRAEYFNVFNRTQFAPAITAQGQGNFGSIIATGNLPRLGQFSARFRF